MKKIVIIGFIFLFLDVYGYDKDNFTLVLIMQQEDKTFLTRIALATLETIKENKILIFMDEEQLIDDQKINDIRTLSEQLNIMYGESHEMTKKLGRKMHLNLSLEDAVKEYCIVALKHGQYEAYVIANDMLDLILPRANDEELDQILQAVAGEKIEMPYIPFPPAVTRVLVAAGLYVLRTYNYLKDSWVVLEKKIKKLIHGREHEDTR